MTPAHFILATAGHVDHGKSALVKALTGTDPDRLPEEKARGITIDLGFAHLELPGQAGDRSDRTERSDALATPRPFSVGIVDVPGHEDFVSNMVAGVGAIDAALLVVAADDGWMPQTEEHLQILGYLGVLRAVVALTKIDLLSGPTAGVIEAVRARLAGSPFADAPVVPVSALDGRGLAELRQALAHVLEAAPPPADYGKPRLPIDRVFVLRGIGTVVTGTLIGGALRRGQEVVIQPGGGCARIRALQSHNRELDVADPGMRVALNLPELHASGDPGAGLGAVRRGAVITLADLNSASTTLDVRLGRSTRAADLAAPRRRPPRDGARVWIHLGCARAAARMVLLEARTLEPGARVLAQLRLETPLFAFAGDRFVVRDWAEQATLAGGVVLDPDAARERVRAPERCGFLAALADALGDPKATLHARLHRNIVLAADGALVKSAFAAAAVAAAGAELVAAGAARTIAGGLWVESAAWNRWRMQALEAVDAEHAAHPQRLGLALNELRTRVEPLFPRPGLFDPLVADLCQRECAVGGAVIRRREHQAALPAELRPIVARIRAALAARPLEPPARDALAPNPAARQALRFLLETGQLVELSTELVLAVEVYARLSSAVRRQLQQAGTATVSELRQALGATRRLVVPLLERMDRDGITSRDGDRRRLRSGG